MEKSRYRYRGPTTAASSSYAEPTAAPGTVRRATGLTFQRVLGL